MFLFVQSRKVNIPSFTYPLIIYIIYLFIWAFFNGEIERRGLLNILINNVNLQIFLVIVIIYNTHFKNKFITVSAKIFKITVILAFIASIIQVSNFDFLNPREHYEVFDYVASSIYEERRTSIFGFVEPNELGLSFIPLLSVLLGYMFFNKQKLIIPYIIMGGIVAVLTNSRYIIVGYFIILIQYILYILYTKYKIKSLFKFVFYSFFIVFSLYWIVLYLGYDFQDFFAERLFKEGSIIYTTRYLAYELFLRFFPKNTLFGTGVHLTSEIEYFARAGGSSGIHVGYLSHLVSYGLVGSFFLFGFWYLLAKKLYRTAKETNYWGSFFAFLMYLWSQATFVQFSIFYYGLLFAFVFDKYFMQKEITNFEKSKYK